MTGIAFDTHKFVRRLLEAGIPEHEAEAIVGAFRDAQGEAELATKTDIGELRHDLELLRRDMRELESRLVIRLGAMVVVAVGVVAALAKLL
jgi:polyhydroxyalkanoate synthesis regulator phasin